MLFDLEADLGQEGPYRNLEEQELNREMANGFGEHDAPAEQYARSPARRGECVRGGSGHPPHG